MILFLRLALFGFWSTLKRLAVAGFTWLTASTTHLLIALCAVLALWGAYQRHEATKWHRTADKAVAALKSQQRAYDKASAENAAAQVAQNKAWEAKSTKLAKDADNEYSKGIADARRRAADYAASHGVRSNENSGGTTTTPGQTPTPQSGNGPGDSPLVVTRADLDACTVNSARVSIIHDWGAALVKDGLAQ